MDVNCRKFLRNPDIDPRTNEPITPDDYEYFSRLCGVTSKPLRQPPLNKQTTSRQLPDRISTGRDPIRLPSIRVLTNQQLTSVSLSNLSSVPSRQLSTSQPPVQRPSTQVSSRLPISQSLRSN